MMMWRKIIIYRTEDRLMRSVRRAVVWTKEEYDSLPLERRIWWYRRLQYDFAERLGHTNMWDMLRNDPDVITMSERIREFGKQKG